MLAFAKVFPCLEDRTSGHRLHPEALDRLLDFTDVHDILEDELTFAASVTGVDNDVEFLLFSQTKHVLEAIVCLLDWLELEFLWDRRQHLKVPREVFAVGASGHLQLDEVTDRRGDGGIFVLEILCVAGFALFLKFAQVLGQGFGEVGGDGRLFGNN